MTIQLVGRVDLTFQPTQEGEQVGAGVRADIEKGVEQGKEEKNLNNQPVGRLPLPSQLKPASKTEPTTVIITKEAKNVTCAVI